MATHSNILACKIPRTGEPSGLQSRQSQSQTLLCDWAHKNNILQLLQNILSHSEFHKCQMLSMFCTTVGNQWQPCKGINNCRKSWERPGKGIFNTGIVFCRVSLDSLMAMEQRPQLFSTYPGTKTFKQIIKLCKFSVIDMGKVLRKSDIPKFMILMLLGYKSAMKKRNLVQSIN